MRVALIAVFLTGCLGYAEVATGPAVAVHDAAVDPEWALATRTALAPRFDDGPTVGLGASARTRLGESGFDLSAGPEVCLMAPGDASLVALCPGASLLTVGYRDEGVSLGTLSPHLTATLAKRTDGPMGFFVGATVGYDVRVTPQSSSPWAGLTVGYGVVGAP